MKPDLDAALLRLFIRHNIPPHPSAVERRREQYLQERQELIGRTALARTHPDFLSKDGFDRKSAGLLAQARADIDRIICDPIYYQDWRASAEDWRTLALAQALATDPKTFGFDEQFPRKGDDHYFYESVISQVGRTNPDKPQIWVTKKAAEIINKAIQVGDYTPQGGNRQKTVEASTLNEFWSKRIPSIRARWERYSASLHDDTEPEDYRPSYIRRHCFTITQYENLELSAERMSLRSDGSEFRVVAPWIFPILSDFAAWRRETDAPALPSHIVDWDEWREWRQTLSANDLEIERELYRRWAQVRRSRL